MSKKQFQLHRTIVVLLVLICAYAVIKVIDKPYIKPKLPKNIVIVDSVHRVTSMASFIGDISQNCDFKGTSIPIQIKGIDSTDYSPKKRKELQRFLQRKLNISRVISLKAPETTTGSAVVTATVYCNGVDIAVIIKGQDNNK